ncbi:hypothetical protein PG993_003135 [Apiospora rasikravindrae]|uniref:Clr5 domain-containing protein n=1 Tax=Apiospora rasikravindrae TaxID=990691 RepID=A0ABR1TYI9_9PEZI
MESDLLFTPGDLRSDGDDASNAEPALRERSGSYAPNVIQTTQSLLQPPAGEPGRSTPKKPRRNKQQAECPRAHRGVGRISQYSEEEWDAYKATLYQLYMVEGRTLQEVQQIMKAVYLFPATTKMFKTRFKRWGWFKNISRKHPSRAKAIAAAATTAGEGEECSMVTRGHRRGRLMTHMNPAVAASVTPRWLNLPDHLAFQELPLVTSRAYVRSQFEGQGWVAEALGTKQVRADHDRFDFTESETTILWTLHLMKIGCVREAYETIHAFCDMLKTGVTTLHPLMLYEFWLLWRKAYDICVMVHDDKFELLRSLITFLCDATENNFRGTTVSSHPVSRILRFSRSFLEGECSDAVVTHALNSGMRASARTLEEMLGHEHPTILMTWNTLAWYQRGSAASSKNFVRQYRKALRRAEDDLGPESPVAIGILFDFLYHVFYVLQETEEEEVAGVTGTGCCARSMAEDLLRRCAAQMDATTPGEPLVIIFRAYASAMLMVGILELEAGDTALFCARIVEAAATLRRRGYAQMAQMLELDYRDLLAALEEGKDLRSLPLNLSRPRCSDAEREVSRSSLMSSHPVHSAQYSIFPDHIEMGFYLHGAHGKRSTDDYVRSSASVNSSSSSSSFLVPILLTIVNYPPFDAERPRQPGDLQPQAVSRKMTTRADSSSEPKREEPGDLQASKSYPILFSPALFTNQRSGTSTSRSFPVYRIPRECPVASHDHRVGRDAIPVVAVLGHGEIGVFPSGRWAATSAAPRRRR